MFIYKQTDALSMAKTLADESVDLIITSPPYNIGKVYEKDSKNKPLDEYLESFKPDIAEFVRILKPTGNLCWQVGSQIHNGEVFPLDIFFYPIFKDFGLKLRNRIIWRRGGGLSCHKRFSGRYETILWFSKSDEYTFNLDPVRVPQKFPGKKAYKGEHKGEVINNPKGKNPEDVWEITINKLIDDWDSLLWDIPGLGYRHPEKTIHPCQFPIELVERCVLALTNPGDTVFDPYAGVGSSLLAAIMHDREAIGSEILNEYVEIGLQRIAGLEDGTLSRRPIHKEISKPYVKIADRVKSDS